MAKNGVGAFAFGVPWTIWSNQTIAWIAAKHANQNDARIFTQQDVQFGPEYDKLRLDVEYLPGEDPSDPPPTLRIARWIVDRVIEEEIDKLVVVGAGPHLWRCMRDMKEAALEKGLKSLMIKPAPEISKEPEDKWFCLDSTQPRTQTKENWNKRERVLKVMPFFIYKRVAK